MIKPNFLEMAQQNLKEFSWPIWFPYPSSWLRALVLLPIALPATHFLIFGLTGVIISLVEKNHILLLFSILFGLFLPTMILAFIYNFIWYLWHKRKSRSYLSKVIPGLVSIWEALYTIFVLVFSFTVIVAIFSELAFLDCGTSQINICTGRFTQRVVNLILGSINNKSFFLRPWFIVWLFTVSYLYQFERLLRILLTKKLLRLLILRRNKAYQNDVKDTSAHNSDNLTNINSKPSKRKLFGIPKYPQKSIGITLLKVILGFLVLAGGGTYLYTKFPEMKENLSLYMSSPNVPSPRGKRHPDLLQKAFNRVMSTGNLAKSATSPREWTTVVTQWQAAIALWKNPTISPDKYTMTQRKVREYKRKLGYTK